jgi:superfamily II DNA or RNA helicase
MDFLILDTPPLSPKQFIQQLGRVARTKDGFAYCLIGEHPTEKRMEFVRDLKARRMKKHLDPFLD